MSSMREAEGKHEFLEGCQRSGWNFNSLRRLCETRKMGADCPAEAS